MPRKRFSPMKGTCVGGCGKQIGDGEDDNQACDDCSTNPQ